MKSVAAVLLGVIVLLAAAFGANYTFGALSLSNRGLTGPGYEAVIWGAGLAGQALAGYASARAAGRMPYVHAIGVGAVVVGLILSPSFIHIVPDWWAAQTASVNLLHLPGLLAGAWIASQRGN